MLPNGHELCVDGELTVVERPEMLARRAHGCHTLAISHAHDGAATLASW